MKPGQHERPPEACFQDPHEEKLQRAKRMPEGH